MSVTKIVLIPTETTVRVCGRAAPAVSVFVRVEAVGDLVSSGHGFLLRTLGVRLPSLVPTPCRYCGEVIRG